MVKVTESFIRFQKAPNGKYFQLVLVVPKPDGTNKEVRFSKGFYDIFNYVNGRHSRKFLICPLMFDKNSAKYKHFLKDKQNNFVKTPGKAKNLAPESDGV